MIHRCLRNIVLLALVLMVGFMLGCDCFRASRIPNIANVTLNAVWAEELTVTVNGGSTGQLFSVSGGAADGDVPVSITTQWTLGPPGTTVALLRLLRLAVECPGATALATTSARRSDGSDDQRPACHPSLAQTNQLGPRLAALLFDQVVALTNLSSSRNDNLICARPWPECRSFRPVATPACPSAGTGSVARIVSIRRSGATAAAGGRPLPAPGTEHNPSSRLTVVECCGSRATSHSSYITHVRPGVGEDHGMRSIAKKRPPS